MPSTVCMLLPGPEAQQLAIYAGWLLHGTAGGIVAEAFFVIPSIFVLLGLSHTQAMDGLALAETTPGPLIMVLQFVGFMSAWNHPQGLSPATAVIGALLTTYATFLPSFFFILLCAPSVEPLRGDRGLARALAGITAAVVGVILNLALVFGASVLWPDGIYGRLDVVAALLSLAALAVIARLKVDAAWVVLAGAVVGILMEIWIRS